MPRVHQSPFLVLEAFEMQVTYLWGEVCFFFLFCFFSPHYMLTLFLHCNCISTVGQYQGHWGDGTGVDRSVLILPFLLAVGENWFSHRVWLFSYERKWVFLAGEQQQMRRKGKEKDQCICMSCKAAFKDPFVPKGPELNCNIHLCFIAYPLECFASQSWPLTELLSLDIYFLFFEVSREKKTVTWNHTGLDIGPWIT